MPECDKTHVQQSRISKFSGGGPPDPLFKGRGGKGNGGEERKGKGRTEGRIGKGGKGQRREEGGRGRKGKGGEEREGKGKGRRGGGTGRDKGGKEGGRVGMGGGEGRSTWAPPPPPPRDKLGVRPCAQWNSYR